MFYHFLERCKAIIFFIWGLIFFVSDNPSVKKGRINISKAIIDEFKKKLVSKFLKNQPPK